MAADKEGSSIDSQEFMTRIAGSNGGGFYDSTSGTAGVVSGDFGWLLCLTATVIEAITTNYVGTSVLIGVSLPAGTLIPGRTTSFKLTSGLVSGINR